MSNVLKPLVWIEDAAAYQRAGLNAIPIANFRHKKMPDLLIEVGHFVI